MSDCAAELCRYWTGMGCACKFLDLEPGWIDDKCPECGGLLGGAGYSLFSCECGWRA